MALVSSPQPATDDRLVIAIDGPSGSGKSSTARGVAARLGLDYLDTGAMYRAATWRALHSGTDLADTAAVAALVSAADLDLSLDPQAPVVVIDGTDVTTAIREPEVSAAVSQVATNLAVRAHMVAQQQQVIAASRRGIVAEGRDITTVVAPEADLRLLLVADPNARVTRRRTELGGKVTADQVTDQVLRRDRDDATVAQFEQAADGVTVIDSTDLGLTQVIDLICSMVAAVDSARQTSDA